MSTLAAQIKNNGQAIEALRGRVQDTFATRDLSTADRDAWSRACLEFHARYPDLFFPGGMSHWKAFLDLDPAGLETAISFLEADRIFFRSGYLKQIIWNRMKRAVLSSRQEARLERVAGEYLQRTSHREFWHMVRYVRMRGSPVFWQSVESLASAGAEPARTRCHWLLLTRANHPVKNWVAQELRRAKYEPGHRPQFWFSPNGV